jgi:hypothetical protein
MRTLTSFLLLFATLAFGQGRPNFTGTWKVIEGTNPRAVNRVEQTDSTISIIPVFEHGSGKPVVYPTNGEEKKQWIGHTLRKRNGHWEDMNLVLESKTKFHGREHMTRQIVSLSADGNLMTMSFQAFGRNHEHDYKVVSERVAH